ncbi:hypothetical protein F0562_000362 [Nyssa sinensis]|uniref:RING-type domain-containing protein n=1 Tax=Nyssa sinensis TaxID=561372 RepID=A0A5J5C084_9ASTE|nr:hypothetical protein F0562_000362 [Nyssa sinensis]
MAGMLPGVGVPTRRRTTYYQHHHEDSPYHGHHSHRWSDQSTMPAAAATTTTMDEAALRARQRLEVKLSYLCPSRSSNIQASEGRGNNDGARTNTKESSLGSRMLKKAWNFQLNSSKSDGQVCVVCLEDFKAEQEVMDLSCSHKYHSKCLLPWLADHPNCPCCRTPVPS